MSHDWMYPDQAGNFSVEKFYTDLKWARNVRGAMFKTKKTMQNVYEILYATGGKEMKKILIEASPGMGKTSTMARFALQWVEESDSSERGFFARLFRCSPKKVTPLGHFDFLFLIPLRNVDKTSSLAELVKAQLGIEVPTKQIADILEGKTKHKVMLILDGYDEYTPGTNKDIDKIIESTVSKHFLIVTSRPGYVQTQVRYKMDGEVVIEGFSPENINKCSTKYLGTEEMTDAMLEQAKTSGIDKLLHVPIILLMACMVYAEKESLPETQTELYSTVYELIMDRTTLKIFGKKSSELRNLDALLSTLGEVSWRALQSDDKQLLLKKDELEKKEPDVLKLGLLSEISIHAASVKENPTFLSFHHKSLQEFSSAQHVTQKLEKAKDAKATLKELFPSWIDVLRYEEVVVFTAGLLRDPQPLVDHVYQMHIERRLNQMRGGEEDVEGETRVASQGKRTYNLGVFTSLYREVRIELPGEPLHNQHVNLYRFGDKQPYTPVYRPSRYYLFSGMKEDVTLESHPRQQEEIPECAIYIYGPDAAAAKNLLRTCEKIWQLQPVTDLWIHGLKCDDVTEVVAPPTISSKARSLDLYQCDLPSGFVSDLLQQYIKCPTTLQKLYLEGINASKEFKEEWRRRFEEANIEADIR